MMMSLKGIIARFLSVLKLHVHDLESNKIHSDLRPSALNRHEWWW
jgi:hypothetical protein